MANILIAEYGEMVKRIPMTPEVRRTTPFWLVWVYVFIVFWRGGRGGGSGNLLFLSSRYVMP